MSERIKQTVCIHAYRANLLVVSAVYRPPIQGGPTASSQSRLAKDASVFKSSEVTVGFAIAVVAKRILEERAERPDAEVL